MKVQATLLLTFQAKSLAEAGAVMDDVLARARERDDVDVGRVELLSPPGDRTVTHTSRLQRAPETAHSDRRSSTVFGWEAEDLEAGAAGAYAMAQRRDAAGLTLEEVELGREREATVWRQPVRHVRPG